MAKKKKYTKYRTITVPKIIIDIMAGKYSLNPFIVEKDEHPILIGISMVHEIISKSHMYANYDKFPHMFIPTSQAYLQKKYGRNYYSYRRWLANNNIIWTDKSFKGHAICSHLYNIDEYNLFYDSLINQDCKIENIITISSSIDKRIKINTVTQVKKEIDSNQKSRAVSEWYQIKIPITRRNKKYLTNGYDADTKFINNTSKYLREMGKYFRNNLKIDSTKAIAHTENQFKDELSVATNDKQKNKAYYRYLARMASIRNIEGGAKNKTLRFRRNSTNDRVDTNLTNMASDLRPFIIGIENMTYFDLSNSQPVLFNLLLDSYRNFASDKLIKEIDRYRELTLAGKWYEELMNIYKERGFTWNDCKLLWMLTAYSKNNSLKVLKREFKSSYPEIYEIIHSIKKNNHSEFAIRLQRIESDIFIRKISKTLVENDIIPYTMHDGLLVNDNHADKTYSIMKEILENELGTLPHIKIEKIC